MWSDWLVFCDCGFQSVCPLMEDKRLMEASWWERLTERETRSCSDGQGHAQEISNIIFCWWVGLCPLPVIYLGPNYGGGNEDSGSLLPCTHCCTQCPHPCIRPLPTHASAGDSQTLTGKSGSVSCGVTAPFSWVLVCTRLCVYLQESVSSVLSKFWQLCGGVNGDLLQEGLCHTQVCCTQSPCPCGSSLLTRTSTGDTQTQFCLSLWRVSGSWCAQGLFEPS